jgi:hypothetical protein
MFIVESERIGLCIEGYGYDTAANRNLLPDARSVVRIV